MRSTTIIASVVSIGSFFIILILLYFCCRQRVANLYQSCISIGSRSSSKNVEKDDDRPGFFARFCACCKRGDDDDDEEEDDEEEEEKKKKKEPKSARSWGLLNFHFTFPFLFLFTIFCLVSPIPLNLIADFKIVSAYFIVILLSL